MKNLAWLGIRLGLIVGAAAVCTGCPNPNTYGTPRTTPVGRVQHTVAAEGFGASFEQPLGNGQTRSDGGTLPNFPSYQLRIGVADTVDVGVKILNMTSVGADVKWNFIKGDTFDMAAVPGFQVFHFSTNDVGFTQFYGNLPLLFGINVSDSVTIVPAAGVTYSLSSGSADNNDGNSAAFSEGGLWLRGGLGFNFRVSPKFAMHPEITFLKNLPGDGETDALLYIFGLGFNFGALPVYGSPEPEAK